VHFAFSMAKGPQVHTEMCADTYIHTHSCLFVPVYLRAGRQNCPGPKDARTSTHCCPVGLLSLSRPQHHHALQVHMGWPHVVQCLLSQGWPHVVQCHASTCVACGPHVLQCLMWCSAMPYHRFSVGNIAVLCIDTGPPCSGCTSALTRPHVLLAHEVNPDRNTTS